MVKQELQKKYGLLRDNSLMLQVSTRVDYLGLENIRVKVISENCSLVEEVKELQKPASGEKAAQKCWRRVDDVVVLGYCIR